MNLLVRYSIVRYNLLSCLRSVYYVFIGVKSSKDAWMRKKKGKKKTQEKKENLLSSSVSFF